MSVRSFHSVFMVTVVAGAALGCYLVSLRVASERSALDQVERQIVQTQYDIRLLQTEIGTRGRLAQLERWNVRVLELSAPGADQILGDKFQLARLIAPQTKPALEAPVILATAPSPEPGKPLGEAPESEEKSSGNGEILHRAGLKVASSGEAREPAPAKPEQAKPKQSRPEQPKPVQPKPVQAKPSGAKTPATKPPAEKSPVRAASIDPLAPLPAGDSSEGSRTNR